MKDLKLRFKSIVVWLGFISSAFLAANIDFAQMTSWSAVGNALYDFICNPASIIAFLISLYAIVNNPTNRSGF